MSLNLMKCWEIFVQNMDMFFYGIRVTLLYAIVGTIVGFLIGLILGGIRGLEINESDSALVKGLKRAGHLITGCYVWVFRGTPMMVQAMFFYYFLKDLIGWNMATAGMFIISINTGAYMAEIIRSGLQSVDKGQTEAAKSIGMSTADITLHYFSAGHPQCVSVYRKSADRQYQRQLYAECIVCYRFVFPKSVYCRKQSAVHGNILRYSDSLSDFDNGCDFYTESNRKTSEYGFFLS